VKNVKSDSDSSVGRLLAETLDAHAASVPEGACLDAGTLAAWADDALSSGERAQSEAHAASCARCQAMLAVMIKTAPQAVTRKRPWRIPALGWLIPLTAAAAAVLLWTIVPGRMMPPSSDRPVPEVRATAPADRRPASTPAPAKQDQAELRRRLTASRVPPDLKAPAAASTSQPDAKSGAEKAAALDRLENFEKRGQAASAANRLATAGAVIVSTSPASRWRFVTGGGVERSTDGGVTWQAQETGATVTLAGGASPSPSVCWLVGPAGTVLLSTDGKFWQRIPFPEPTDLTSVRAADDRTATVTASDGRTFTTRDGGLTWVRSGNAR
jgi:hypothetical protein